MVCDDALRRRDSHTSSPHNVNRIIYATAARSILLPPVTRIDVVPSTPQIRRVGHLHQCSRAFVSMAIEKAVTSPGHIEYVNPKEHATRGVVTVLPAVASGPPSVDTDREYSRLSVSLVNSFITSAEGRPCGSALIQVSGGPGEGILSDLWCTAVDTILGSFKVSNRVTQSSVGVSDKCHADELNSYYEKCAVEFSRSNAEQ